ncbi:MAG TPA: thioredoxin family protein [Allocoleopsis sp.]
MDKNLLRRRHLLLVGFGILGAGVATAAVRGDKRASTPAIQSSRIDTLDSAAAMPVASKTIPEFEGIREWLNSDPLTIAGLKGNVVLVQFWTFACINCQRTLPYVTQWHRQYAAQGLKVIGVHTPEFAFEREVGNIERALRQHQITYAVPMDNDYKTWNAYANQYWPHLYLADRQGVLRYDHIGEGAYDKTEQTIQQLLNQA